MILPLISNKPKYNGYDEYSQQQKGKFHDDVISHGFILRSILLLCTAYLFLNGKSFYWHFYDEKLSGANQALRQKYGC